ncbi:MAG: hypothetical protein CMG66_02800 [Candidatus Marinimicrobia bacterium]|nr:hypothetical protein [Candidatus Neomarinimicrobiota bacterium]|tara:strand:- start:19032 stop:21365 length:2334 start_codon:yes stop_codon:yes gene_type:complete
MNDFNENSKSFKNTDSSFDYSLKELYYILKNHAFAMLVTFFIVISIVIYYTLTVKPVYESSSTVMVRQDQKSMSIFSMLDMGLTKDRNYIENEIEVLKSSTTLDVVVNRLFESKYKNDLFLFGTKKYEPSWIRAFLTFGIDSFASDFELGEELNDSLKIIFSDRLLNSLDVLNKRNTDAIKITVKSKSPIESKLIANVLIDVYRERDLNWLTAEMGHLKNFLSSQLKQKEKELNQIEEKLKKFQEEKKIFGLEDNSKLILENLTDIESRYNNILAMIDINSHKIKHINDLLTIDEKEFSESVTNTINDRLFALKNELALSEAELVSLETQYGKNHAALELLNNKIEILKSNLKDETRVLISQGVAVANPIDYRQGLMDSVIHFKTIKGILESKAISYKKLVDSYDAKLSSLPEKMLEYARLERQRVIQAETFSFMSTKLEEARIGEASKLGKIRIIDHAIVDSKPISPNKLMNLISGILFAIACSVAIAFLIDYSDQTIKSIELIEKKGIPILSMVPDLTNLNVHGKSRKNIEQLKAYITDNQIERKLIAYEDPKSPVSEAYRSLRTSLLYTSNKDMKGQCVLLSSCGPGEGKTTTVANLAVTYSTLGKKVLLIDSDLRKPVNHKVFKVSRSPGFSSYLSGQKNDIEEIINKTYVDNLDILSAGITPPNPSELLESDTLGELMHTLKQKYDIILIDTPPLIAVADAYILMKYIDKFVLIVRAGVTEKGAFERVCSELQYGNFPITGVVMNAMTEEHHSYGAGYYYNYSNYYYSDNDS